MAQVVFAPRGRFGKRPSVAERVTVEGDCWVWHGARDEAGYGLIWNGHKILRGHRWMWEALVGSVPEGLEADHLCRNKACMNPDHIEWVTHAENVQRAKKRHVCVNGHRRFPWNVRWRNGKPTGNCIECQKEGRQHEK